MSRAVVQGTYADLKFVKSRKVAQVTIEIPIEGAEAFVRAFGAPNPAAEIPVALARIEPEAAEKTRKDPSEKRKWADMPLAQQAAIRCGEKAFWRFLSEEITSDAAPPIDSQEAAAELVRAECGVSSRRHIEESPRSSARWVEIDTRFQNWMHTP